MSGYSYILGVLVACVSYLVYQRYVILYPSVVSKPEKRYDYIIVGAGTTGCVLAARLSEDPKVKVLLVEAGHQMGYFTKIPLTATAAQQGPDDWSVRSKPQKYSSFGLWDQTQIIPRGKGLGGSGQINFLLHGFGLPEDFDRWSARGFKGWGLKDLEPYFIKAFGTVRSEFDSEHCSMDGHCPGAKAPMKLQLIDDKNELLRTFQQASAKLKNKHTILRKATATIKDGVRFSTLDGYLKNALNRRNLHVVLRTQAISVASPSPKSARSLYYSLTRLLRHPREDMEWHYSNPTPHRIKWGIGYGGLGMECPDTAGGPPAKNTHPRTEEKLILPFGVRGGRWGNGKEGQLDMASVIRFDNNTASSLFILRNNRELDNVFVNREIILCAGAIKTPQILMMSGIGPRDIIQRLNIKLIVNNKEVGRNLHDHMNMPLYVSVKKPVSVTLPKVFTLTTMWEYFMNGQGLLSFPPVAGVEYHNASALMLFSMGTTSEKLLRDLSNYKHTVFRATFPFHNDSSKEGFIFLATCAQPQSRGSVSLRDLSTAVPPVVDPNYLCEGADLRCMIKAIRRAECLVSSPPFQDIGARIHWPRPERCLPLWNYTRVDQFGPEHKRRRKIKPLLPNQVPPKKKKVKEHKPNKPQRPPDEFLECILREVAVTGHHIGGTAAGGTVVDDKLRVKSVSGLRVVDASIIPSPLSLYPNSVLVAMAEKAADIIKQTTYLKLHDDNFFVY